MKKFLAMLLVLTLTLALLAGCGAPAADKGSEGSEPVDPAQTDATDNGGSAEPVTLKVGLMGTSTKPVGVLVADKLGYFAEEGVDVQFEKVSSMNDAYLAVSTGDLDVYLFSSTAAATFISQGTTDPARLWRHRCGRL